MTADFIITASLAMARAVHLWSCLLAFGVWTFDRLVIPTVATESSMEVGKLWNPIARVLLVVALPLGIVSGAAWIAMVAININSPDLILNPDVLSIVWNQTQFGQLWHFRLFIWLAAIFPIFFWRLSRLRLAMSWFAFSATGLWVASLAWAGHGQTGRHGGWHLSADIIHLLTTSIWPIGLVPFALLLIQLRRHHRPRFSYLVASLTRRFSCISLCSVVILTTTGLVNSWILVGSTTNLLHTAYGRFLLAKVALFCLLIILGAINLLRLKPKISTDDHAIRQLHRNVMIEIFLATVIIILVGIIGVLPPGVG